MVNNEDEFDDIFKTTAEQILLFNIPELITTYETKIFESIAKKEFKETEKHLFDLAFDILEMQDEDQVFLLKFYFISIVTEIIRLNTRTNRLHPERLAHGAVLITAIESWENITEFILSINWFVNYLNTKLIKNTTFFTGNSHVEKVLTMITLNIEKKHLNLNWLAEELQISTTHLSNVFKIHMGETITKYIKNKRIDRITFDLKYTNQSIKNIRLKYGFENQSHFIQYFKKAQGETPLAYKRNLLD